MCIAICSPKGNPIPFSDLQEGCKSNPHGFGFAYADNGQVIVKKGFFKFADVWKEFKEINGNFDSIFHARWSTHGAQNALNCHPWRINDTHAMMHNGVLKHYTGIHNGLSDTGNFNIQILKPLINAAPEIIKTEWFNALMGQAIGSEKNKIAIINGQGEITIFNEHLGHWKDGVWFSNYDYVPKKKRKVKKSAPVLVNA